MNYNEFLFNYRLLNSEKNAKLYKYLSEGIKLDLFDAVEDCEEFVTAHADYSVSRKQFYALYLRKRKLEFDAQTCENTLLKLEKTIDKRYSVSNHLKYEEVYLRLNKINELINWCIEVMERSYLFDSITNSQLEALDKWLEETEPKKATKTEPKKAAPKTAKKPTTATKKAAPKTTKTTAKKAPKKAPISKSVKPTKKSEIKGVYVRNYK